MPGRQTGKVVVLDQKGNPKEEGDNMESQDEDLELTDSELTGLSHQLKVLDLEEKKLKLRLQLQDKKRNVKALEEPQQITIKPIFRQLDRPAPPIVKTISLLPARHCTISGSDK